MCCSDAPDMSGVNAAAAANAEIAKEALAWYKQQYADQTPAREAAAGMAMKVANQQLSSSQQNDAISQDYWNYQKNTFRPMEASIIASANAYDTQAKQDQAASKAMADVEQQFGMEADQQKRAMTRMGVNPNSGKFAALSNQTAMAQAAAKAGAANKAREGAELQGYARKMDAANLGRNLASNQATSAGVAMTAGNSAVNNAGTPLSQANAAAATMNQGFGTAISGNNSAGNLYNQAAQTQASASGSGLADLASIGMSAAKLYPSDMNKKQDIKPMSDEAALKAVEQTPVSSWKYKKGEGDGGKHTGPMAQHVNKTMGEQAAPGGKAIDPITMNGVTMAGLAALSRKVDKLSKKIEGASA